MPNPAFSKDLPNWWAWIPVWLGFITAARVFEDSTSGWKVATAYAATLLLGAAWQFLQRRDLADRLVWLAAMAAAVAVLMAAGRQGASLIRHDSTQLVLLAPLVAGLVLAEQWLRYRDARRRTASAEAVSARH